MASEGGSGGGDGIGGGARALRVPSRVWRRVEVAGAGVIRPELTKKPDCIRPGVIALSDINRIARIDTTREDPDANHIGWQKRGSQSRLTGPPERVAQIIERVKRFNFGPKEDAEDDHLVSDRLLARRLTKIHAFDDHLIRQWRATPPLFRHRGQMNQKIWVISDEDWENHRLSRTIDNQKRGNPQRSDEKRPFPAFQKSGIIIQFFHVHGEAADL
jgi:hypothetical protein